MTREYRADVLTRLQRPGEAPRRPRKTILDAWREAEARERPRPPRERPDDDLPF